MNERGGELPGVGGVLMDRTLERDRLLESGRAGAAWALVERTVLREAVGPELERFLYDSVALAPHCAGEHRAAGWVEAYRKRAEEAGVLDERLVETLKGFRLIAELGARDYPRAERTAASIRWDVLADAPWALNLELVRLLRRGDLAAAFRAIRSSRARFREPVELGNRLRLLALFYLDLGDRERSFRLAEAALRHLRKDPGYRSSVLAIELRCKLGTLHILHGENAEAAALLEEALEKARRRGHVRCLRSHLVELAVCQARLGRHARARELLAAVPPPSEDGAEAPRDEIRLLIGRATVALERGAHREAAAHLEDAEQVLEHLADERYRAYVDAEWADVAAAEGSEAAYRRALGYLERAETVFRRLGTRGVHGVSRTLVTRGGIHLARGETREALACATQSLELARRAGFFPLQARSLLLKSRILADAELPASERVYEEILRELGVVKNPVDLFRILANLYLYSWKLRDRLDLTAHHLDQLRKLQGFLDEDVYRGLFSSCVTRRVLRRFLGE